MTHHRHKLPMAARFHLKNAKTVVSIVIGDAFDKPGENFLGRVGRLLSYGGNAEIVV